jgi:hypothetical protein
VPPRVLTSIALGAVVATLGVAGCGGSDAGPGSRPGPAGIASPVMGATSLDEALQILGSPRAADGCQLRTQELLNEDDYAIGAEGLAHCRNRLRKVPAANVKLVSRSGDRALADVEYPDDRVYFGLIRGEGRWYVYGYGQDPKHPQKIDQPIVGVASNGAQAAGIQGFLREVPEQLGGPIDVSCAPIPHDPFGDWACKSTGGGDSKSLWLVVVERGGGISASEVQGGRRGLSLCCVNAKG